MAMQYTIFIFVFLKKYRNLFFYSKKSIYPKRFPIKNTSTKEFNLTLYFILYTTMCDKIKLYFRAIYMTIIIQ